MWYQPRSVSKENKKQEIIKHAIPVTNAEINKHKKKEYVDNRKFEIIYTHFHHQKLSKCAAMCYTYLTSINSQTDSHNKIHSYIRQTA